MNEYKYQVSDSSNGRIIVARGDDLNELTDEFEEMRSLLFVEETQEKEPQKEPFYTEGQVCPQCGRGKLVRKQGTSKAGKPYDFVGCDNYPNCKHIEKN